MNNTEKLDLYMAGYNAGYQRATADAQDILWCALIGLQAEMDEKCLDHMHESFRRWREKCKDGQQ